MIRSMTGFARREARGDWGRLAWELRTVNHRYLEISARLPEEFRAREPAYRELVGKYLSRGKLELGLRFEPDGEARGALRIDHALAGRLKEAAGELAGILGTDAGLTPRDLLRWPGVVTELPPDLAPVQAAALETLEQALVDLVGVREAEGERIRRMLDERAAAVGELVARVRERLPQVLQGLREKLLGRIAELGIEADPQRLEQELAIVAQRLDVDEELDRLGSHVTELRDVLQRDEPVGRRLDFLMQEFNREANTLGSKSQDAETTRISVELKVLIEQMREQIQNLE